MLKLNEQSKLVRWPNFLRSSSTYKAETGKWSKTPAQTTLCRFFWRCFVFMPLFWLLVTGTPTGILALAIHDFGILTILKYFSGAVLGILATTGVVAGYRADWSRGVRATVRDSIKSAGNSTFVQGAKAIKSKVCPIVRFV